MSADTSLEIPGLIPDPKILRPLEGTAALGREVRLITKGIDRAGAIRDTLTAAGAQVGDGAFTVEAAVVPEADLDLSGVPGDVRDQYYELKIQGNRAALRAAAEDGILLGAHTLADLFRSAGMGAAIPNLAIRDWPDLANRGIFVESKWGPDRMTLDDWRLTIDRLAALKMNRMGIGLYGCWGSCRYEGADRPTEFLMAPAPGYPDLRTEKRLRWVSPEDGAWHADTYLPAMFEQDFLGQVVAYGREKGVTVIPFVNSLGHNTMIPRVLPEVSAKAEDGTPLGIGYCLSNPKTRTFIEGFYRSVIDRYFPGGADYFHIQLDEVWPDFPDPDEPTRRADPWCQCADCRAQAREENLQDYILWLIRMLTENGTRKVVMWNDQLTRHMDALDRSFVQKLKDAGLADRLVLHWWWYSNDALNDKTRVSIGAQLGLPGWVAPMTCYFNWERYSPRLQNIELMMKMAHEEGAEGAVSYAVHDPGWTDHEMLLASYGWHHDAVPSHQAQLEKWANGRFGGEADRFLSATGTLQVAAASQALVQCYYYPYTYVRPNTPFPRAYPGDALAALSKIEDALPQLEETAAAAGEAGKGFAVLVSKQLGDEGDRTGVRSLLGEAARIEGLTKTFAHLLSVQQAIADGIDEDLLQRCDKARGLLLDKMAMMEANKPQWVVPASLQALSVLLEFLDQLRGDLAEAREGTRKPEDIRWQVD